MVTSGNPLRRMLCLLAVVVLLTACGGGSTGLRYYLIDPVRTGPADTSADPLSIEVIDLHIPQYLERFQIVTRDTANRLQLSDSNQWGENLRKNLLRTLSVNLSGVLGTNDVGTPLNRSTSMPDYRLQVHVIKFEQDPDGVVRLSARWQISDHEEMDRGTYNADLEGEYSLGTRDYDAIVASMQELFGQLSILIASTVMDQQG